MPSVSRAVARQAWSERLGRFGQAGQTVSQFCAAEGVSVASFYSWRRKLRGETPVPASLARFIPVQRNRPVQRPTSEPVTPATVMSVELPGGVRVRLEVSGSEVS